ncbi:hypothetical protein BJ508DRAFT_338123 [Ascobolus immersus RN42]|uniref:Uncharacterized protein n=1 Tax=Ascobolus immersus RN42 TaxID=1160509 RepID=A0A3N4HQ63_ASCIM|nr:hypothetical protein BJ508DRAFT_338123 [Ascobolus immersus RN42]
MSSASLETPIYIVTIDVHLLAPSSTDEKTHWHRIQEVYSNLEQANASARQCALFGTFSDGFIPNERVIHTGEDISRRLRGDEEYVQFQRCKVKWVATAWDACGCLEYKVEFEGESEGAPNLSSGSIPTAQQQKFGAQKKLLGPRMVIAKVVQHIVMDTRKPLSPMTGYNRSRFMAPGSAAPLTSSNEVPVPNTRGLTPSTNFPPSECKVKIEASNTPERTLDFKGVPKGPKRMMEPPFSVAKLLGQIEAQKELKQAPPPTKPAGVFVPRTVSASAKLRASIDTWFETPEPGLTAEPSVKRQKVAEKPFSGSPQIINNTGVPPCGPPCGPPTAPPTQSPTSTKPSTRFESAMLPSKASETISAILSHAEGLYRAHQALAPYISSLTTQSSNLNQQVILDGQKQAEIKEQEEQIARRQNELAAYKANLDRESKGLDHLKRHIEIRQKDLTRREDNLIKARAELEPLKQSLEAGAAQLKAVERRECAINEREFSISQREFNHDKKEKLWEEVVRKIEDKRKELDDKEMSLFQRQHELIVMERGIKSKMEGMEREEEERKRALLGQLAAVLGGGGVEGLGSLMGMSGIGGMGGGAMSSRDPRLKREPE